MQKEAKEEDDVAANGANGANGGAIEGANVEPNGGALPQLKTSMNRFSAPSVLKRETFFGILRNFNLMSGMEN